MTLGNNQASIGTTRGPVITADQNSPAYVTVKNRGTVSVFLGDSAVTTGNGFELAAGEEEVVGLDPGETLYAVATSGTQRVDALRMRSLARSG